MTRRSGRVATVSVIVPCRNEERYIARCLDSILGGDYPLERLEVLVVDGRSDDGTPTILADYAARHPVIKVLDNPKRIQTTGLNIGIGAARGEIVVRMDAHVIYPPNYVSGLVAALEETGAGVVGGQLVTLPAKDAPVAKAIARAMSHPFGVGNSYFRIGVREPRWVDTIAFFCCRRETFERAGLFDEDMARDEDSEFNARVYAHGGRTLLVPHVVSYYYARESLPQVGRMCYQYGFSKPIVARKLGRLGRMRQLVPPAFVFSLAVTAILSPWARGARMLFGGIAGTYLLAVLGFSLAAARTVGLRTAAALAVTFPVMHLSYGLGFLRSVASLAFRRGRVRRVDLPLSR